jgi:hypothetical protein
MTLAIVTPSYRNDFSLFVDLHRSVLRYTGETVVHYAIVPKHDLELFGPIAGSRCVIIPEESLYPPHYIRTGSLSQVINHLPGMPSRARIAAINTKRPVHPIRGWMMQQVLKLEFCRRVTVDKVLLVDSDVELVRPLDEAILGYDGHAMLYRKAGAIDADMPIHRQWHVVAHELLGLPPAQFPAADYVSSFCVWDPAVVRAMVDQIEQATSRAWADAITRLRTFSEWTVYGVYATEVMGYKGASVRESSLCHSYWGTSPLTLEKSAEFISAMPPDDVAVLIQSKTHTPQPVRRTVLDTIGSGSNSSSVS